MRRVVEDEIVEVEVDEARGSGCGVGKRSEGRFEVSTNRVARSCAKRERDEGV